MFSIQSIRLILRSLSMDSLVTRAVLAVALIAIPAGCDTEKPQDSERTTPADSAVRADAPSRAAIIPNAVPDPTGSPRPSGPLLAKPDSSEVPHIPNAADPGRQIEYDSSEVDRPPALLSDYERQDPLTASDSGTVMLRVLVGIEGKVIRALISKSSGNSQLDQAALDEARRATYIPGIKDGQIVAVWLTYRYSRPPG